jgi:arylsulfatase A-like enzyme
MVYPDQGCYYNPDYLTAKGEERIEGYSVDVTTDLTLDFLKEHAESDRPFMVMCQYKAPHRNWMPGPDWLNLFDDITFPEPESLFDDYSGRSSSAANHRMGIDQHMTMFYDLKVEQMPQRYAHYMNEFLGRMTPEQRAAWDRAYATKNRTFMDAGLTGKELVRWKYQRYVKDYMRCVAAVDHNIGRLLAYLDESGLSKNTIVVYSSDQGFYLGEHGWFDKRWMYEESFRMPLLMRWPGVIRPGSKITQLTQNIDFAPTFLDAAGLNIPPEIQGKSMIPLFAGQTANWRTSIYYHYYQGGTHGVAVHEGVRDDRYKLIHFYEADEWELFDLETDPNEIISQYDNPEYAPIREKMKAELARLRKQYVLMKP